MENTKLDVWQYDTEYKQTNCFWWEKPSKYVEKISKYVTVFSWKTALDIWAWEWKNSFFLESLWYAVTAVEVSLYAIRNFINIMINKEIEINKKINIDIVCSNVLTYKWYLEYDLIVSYWLLHCLKSEKEIENLINKIKSKTKKGWINIISTFNNELPVPEEQEYLSLTLINADKLSELYSDWEVLEYENEILEHTHSTHEEPHKHWICRIIARKK